MADMELKVVDFEKAAELVKQLSDLADKLDPNLMRWIIGIGYLFLIFLFAKAAFAFYASREDKKLIKENAVTMGKVSQAITNISTIIQGCGFRGGR